MADKKKEYGKIYNKDYYTNYSKGIGYGNKNKWMNDFEIIAENIIELFHPKKVLDIGCAYGYLVEALRNKGVEAYGIDVSEYAVSQADDSIKPFLKSMSALEDLPENFPHHYDLVVSIEMIEHLYEEDGLKLIKRMVSYADKVLISSTDSDFDDPTHFNVRPKEYWTLKFAENGFLRNVEHNVTFISPNTYLFEKSESMGIYYIINHYEKGFPIVRHNYTGIKGKIAHLFNTRLLFFKPFVKKTLKILHLK